jgi:hypothetical protein
VDHVVAEHHHAHIAHGHGFGPSAALGSRRRRGAKRKNGAEHGGDKATPIYHFHPSFLPALRAAFFCYGFDALKGPLRRSSQRRHGDAAAYLYPKRRVTATALQRGKAACFRTLICIQNRRWRERKAAICLRLKDAPFDLEQVRKGLLEKNQIFFVSEPVIGSPRL